jgi:hypothetical protein
MGGEIISLSGRYPGRELDAPASVNSFQHIPGTADPRHMAENLSAMRGKLPDGEQA